MKLTPDFFTIVFIALVFCDFKYFNVSIDFCVSSLFNEAVALDIFSIASSIPLFSEIEPFWIFFIYFYNYILETFKYKGTSLKIFIRERKEKDQ